MKPFFVFASPIGFLRVQEQGHRIIKLFWSDPPAHNARTLALCAVEEWLSDYFSSRHRPIDFPMGSMGTHFQMKVWCAVSQIPPGEVITYRQLAQRLGTSPRSIGSACGTNPLPILVPCHRVIATDGSLGGYSCGDGQETKRKLLEHEGAFE